MDWTDTSGVSGSPQPQFEFLDGISGGGWNVSFNVSSSNARYVDGYFYDLDFDLKDHLLSARKNDALGSFGTFHADLAFPGWAAKTVWSVNSFTNQGWFHVHAYVDPTLPNVDQIGGLAIGLPWQTSTGNTNAFFTNATQTQTFWIR